MKEITRGVSIAIIGGTVASAAISVLAFGQPIVNSMMIILIGFIMAAGAVIVSEMR